MKQILISLFLISFLSCNLKNNNNILTNSEAEELVSTNSMVEHSGLVDVIQLKSDLDSFALKIKKTQLPFEFETDTFGNNSNDKDIWAYQRGIFKLGNIDSTNLLIKHHFFIPKSKRILRVFLLELEFTSIKQCDMFFEKLESRKDYKADLSNGYFLNFGLTGTTDYVVKSNESVLWFNISCQYSKKEFEKLIEVLRQNSLLKGNEKTIKCFCQELCE